MYKALDKSFNYIIDCLIIKYLSK